MCEFCNKLRAASFTPMAQKQQQLSTFSHMHGSISASAARMCLHLEREHFVKFTVKWLFFLPGRDGNVSYHSV